MRTYEVEVLFIFEKIDESNDTLMSNTSKYESFHRYKLGSNSLCQSRCLSPRPRFHPTVSGNLCSFNEFDSDGKVIATSVGTNDETESSRTEFFS